MRACEKIARLLRDPRHPARLRRGDPQDVVTYARYAGVVRDGRDDLRQLQKPAGVHVDV
jgi:hypothetical protein